MNSHEPQHLLHESSHLRLILLLELDPLVTVAEGATFDSPVRKDPRPLWGMLMAVHAFARITAFHGRAHDRTGREIHRELTRQHADLLAKGLDEIEGEPTAEFTEAGGAVGADARGDGTGPAMVTTTTTQVRQAGFADLIGDRAVRVLALCSLINSCAFSSMMPFLALYLATVTAPVLVLPLIVCLGGALMLVGPSLKKLMSLAAGEGGELVFRVRFMTVSAGAALGPLAGAAAYSLSRQALFAVLDALPARRAVPARAGLGRPDHPGLRPARIGDPPSPQGRVR
ncbi:HEXXH motif-containing putative peptide modification protein [Streptomyces sp. NPDC051001]|uniref:aKG-HExxH-type peptide beta-hydroxylase n=1 Tax=Streptomyces sp. NPDC051001 TaxID=3155795 RepID=UPI003433B449